MTLSLDDWWKDQRLQRKMERLQKEIAEKDPGYPATYGTAMGEPTPHPWGACIGAINRLQKVMDFNITAKSLLACWERQGFKYV